MKTKIFRNLFLLSALSIVVTSVMISFIMYNGFYKDMQAEVRQEAKYIAEAVNLNGAGYLDEIRLGGSNRITLIGSTGQALFDNRQNPGDMENHLGRLEVEEALKYGTGEIVRKSDTLGQQTFYCAIRLEDGNVIRVANTASNVYAAAAENIPYVAVICLAMLAIAIFAAKKQTNSIVAPINSLNLEAPLSNEAYDEFSPLLRKLEQQNQIIEETFATLKKEREEFRSITENMNEGLIVLNASGEMLFVNKRAAGIFGKDAIGKAHYLTLNRSAEFREIAEKALNGQAAEGRLKQGGRSYQVMAAPAAAGKGAENKASGAVLFALDITEKEETETIRREFSANVSHELRTPLTAILGYSEIIREGIAKPEDIKAFASKIYREAQRMISLVEDIMKLSRLDEGMAGIPSEQVDLHKICIDVLARLKDKGMQAGVSMNLVSGAGKGPFMVLGIPPMLEELVYNLCDNAIKYNKKGGSLKVELFQNPTKLRVSDTGIGIEKEHQGRIFERFYRVDKSHSKETEGTGLGLSIVKHIVLQHGGKLSIESEFGKGTSIEVEF